MKSTGIKRYPKFWSADRLISTHKPVMIIMSGRSIGKTTNLGYQCIKHYYKDGKRFIYIRRTDDELKLTCKSYFNGGQKLYSVQTGNKCQISYEKGTYKDQDGNVLGFAIPLSIVHKVKSNYEGLNIDYMLYDEFNLKPGLEKFYLGSKAHPLLEWEQLTDLYTTLDRCFGHSYTNSTRMFVSGNGESFYNPILLALHVDKYLQEGQDAFINPKQELWCCEYIQQVGATKEIKKSNGYRLTTQEQRERDYDNAEHVSDWDVTDLRGKGKIVNPVCNLQYAGRKYMLYAVESDGIMYISTRPRDDRKTIALTVGDTTEINQISAIKYQTSPEMVFLRRMAESGNVRYETEQAKRDILTYLKFTI